MSGRMVSLVVMGLLVAALFFGCQSLARKALFYPTHDAGDNGLARWTHEGSLVGFAREEQQVIYSCPERIQG